MDRGRGREKERLTLLSDEEAVALLEGDAVTGVFVVGGEASRVGRLCDFGAHDLLERVDALAVGVEGVHQMHVGRFMV